MSGLLKKAIAIIGGIILEIILLLKQCYITLVIVLVIGVLLYKINKKVRLIIEGEVEIFRYTGKIRNIDCLVIGDMYQLPDEWIRDKRIVQLAAPNRSLAASYEILRHTHSILRDDGKAEVIIAVKEKNIDKEKFNLFDIPFFHYISIELKKLNNLKRKENYPLLFEPINTIILLFNIKSKKFQKKENLSDEVTDFCLKRGYTVEYYCKK